MKHRTCAAYGISKRYGSVHYILKSAKLKEKLRNTDTGLKVISTLNHENKYYHSRKEREKEVEKLKDTKKENPQGPKQVAILKKPGRREGNTLRRKTKGLRILRRTLSTKSKAAKMFSKILTEGGDMNRR